MRDNYWIAEKATTKIFRKGLGNEKPVLFCCTGIRFNWQKRSLSSFMDSRYLVVKSGHELNVIEVKANFSKGIQGVYFQELDGIKSISLLSKENKFMVITKHNKLIVIEAIRGLSEIEFKELDKVVVAGLSNRKEFGQSVVVDPGNQYVITSQLDPKTNKASNLSIFQLTQDFKLNFKMILDVAGLGGTFRFFNFVMYRNDAIIVAGNGLHGPFMCFAYHINSNKLKVLKNKGKKFQHHYVFKFTRIGEGKFEMTDKFCRLFNVKFE